MLYIRTSYIRKIPLIRAIFSNDVTITYLL